MGDACIGIPSEWVAERRELPRARRTEVDRHRSSWRSLRALYEASKVLGSEFSSSSGTGGSPVLAPRSDSEGRGIQKGMGEVEKGENRVRRRPLLEDQGTYVETTVVEMEPKLSF